MKTTLKLLIISTFAAFIFQSCGNKTVETEERVYADKVYLTADSTDGVLTIDFNIAYPIKFKDIKVLNSIKTAINAELFGKKISKLDNEDLINQFVIELINDYKENNVPLVDKLDDNSLYSFNNDHIVESYPLLSDDKIFSYGINRYIYMGGAHGITRMAYLNFDLKTGKQLTENDLFVDGYHPLLAELIKNRIVEESQLNPEVQTIINLKRTDYYIDSIKPNGNFYITDEGINYVFNPYEIAPYYLGQTDVTIPYERLTDILKPKSVISYLVEEYLKNKE